MEDNKYLIPIAIVIAGALIAWGFFSNNNTEIPTKNIETNQNQKQSAQLPLQISFRDSDYILGNPNAEIKMITFTDFECPYCKNFHESMIKITDEYAKEGKVAWTLRHFPVHGTPTQLKAAATECAGLLGGDNQFWEMSKKIFQNDGQKWISVDKLPTLAMSLGLDKEKFEECLKEPKIINKVEQDFQSGRDLGVEGTPFTAVIVKSGEVFPINGAQPYESVKNMIEMILKDQASE